MWFLAGLIQLVSGKAWEARAEANPMCYQVFGKTGLKMSRVDQTECHSGMWNAQVEMEHWSGKSN